MFGPIWSILESKLRKSENVTFLDLLKAKNQKKTNDGKNENLLTDGLTDGRSWFHKDS